MLFVTLKAMALALLIAPAMVVAAADPIEGRWYGQVGFPQDRVDIGLEFRRNAAGELKAYLYQPVINFYGLELPGVVQVHGANYTLKEYGYSITRKGETLDCGGSFRRRSSHGYPSAAASWSRLARCEPTR